MIKDIGNTIRDTQSRLFMGKGGFAQACIGGFVVFSWGDDVCDLHLSLNRTMAYSTSARNTAVMQTTR